jgi:hypothetical protein
MAMNEQDWINCIKSRQKPFCEVEEARVSACLWPTCRQARPGDQGPDKEQVIGDKEAAAMCAKPYRAPWDKALRSVITV